MLEPAANQPDTLSAVIQEIQQKTTATCKRGISGAQLTTFAIGGALDLLVEPNSEAELQQVLKILNQYDLKPKILGAGSNLLIADSGISGCCLRLGKAFRYCRKASGNNFETGAAMSLMAMARDLCGDGFSGLEFAGGIPASLGGAVYMNAGAHHGEISDLIKSVTVLTAGGDFLQLTPTDLQFSYRHCNLPAGAIVLKAELELQPGDKQRIVSRRQEFLTERKRRQPLSSASAGSVFRNPSPERSAGAILEEAGLKGERVGGAQVSKLHANWIINPERRASAADVLALIEICQKRAKESFDIALRPELVHLS